MAVKLMKPDLDEYKFVLWV